MTADTLDLEGNELRIIRIGRADTAESTVLYVPSLAAVVTGDLAYNEVHMMTAEAGEPERAQWIANLDKVAALEPAFVVAGHKKVENDNDPKIIGRIPAISAGFLPDRRRGDHSGRHRRPDGRTLSRLGEPPHALAFRENSHRAEGLLDNERAPQFTPRRASCRGGPDPRRLRPCRIRRPARLVVAHRLARCTLAGYVVAEFCVGGAPRNATLNR